MFASPNESIVLSTRLWVIDANTGAILQSFTPPEISGQSFVISQLSGNGGFLAVPLGNQGEGITGAVSGSFPVDNTSGNAACIAWISAHLHVNTAGWTDIGVWEWGSTAYAAIDAFVQNISLQYDQS